MEGGDGNDLLVGQGDREFGGFGELRGGAGGDTYVLHAPAFIEEARDGGFDTVFVTAARDAFVGEHIEVVYLVDQAAKVWGAVGADVLVANPTVESTLPGQGGDDTLWGSAGADTLDGGDGRDTLYSGGGADILAGGRGGDSYVVSDTRVVLREPFLGGFDTAWVQVSDWPADPSPLVDVVRLLVPGRITGSTSEDVLSAHAPDTTLDGGMGGDELWGDANRNVLLGGRGDDVLRGGAGDDLLEGGEGADQLVGGAGRDLVVFGEAPWKLGGALRDQILEHHPIKRSRLVG